MDLFKIFKEAEHIKARVLLVHKDDTDAKWSTLCAANKIAVEKDEDAGSNEKLTDADADKWCKENNAVWMPSTLTSRPVLKMKLEQKIAEALKLAEKSPGSAKRAERPPDRFRSGSRAGKTDVIVEESEEKKDDLKVVKDASVDPNTKKATPQIGLSRSDTAKDDPAASIYSKLDFKKEEPTVGT